MKIVTLNCMECPFHKYEFYKHKGRKLHICVPNGITLRKDELELPLVEKPYFCIFHSTELLNKHLKEYGIFRSDEDE